MRGDGVPARHAVACVRAFRGRRAVEPPGQRRHGRGIVSLGI